MISESRFALHDKTPILVWFRRDLRLADNPALSAAFVSNHPVIPVFIWDDSKTTVSRLPGAASKWWLHNSLTQLSISISERKGKLILRRGSTENMLRKVINESGSCAVYSNRSFIRAEYERDLKLQQQLRRQGVEVRFFDGSTLINPECLFNRQQQPYQVFTPFWHRLREIYSPMQISTIPNAFPPAPNIKSDSLSQWKLLPTRPDWAAGLRTEWTVGEISAQQQLSHSVNLVLNGYQTSRDRPDLTGTSRLSPHLCWGEISPHQIWRAVTAAVSENRLDGNAATSFLREVAWRDFNHHLLFHHPQMETQNWRPEFNRFPWQENSDAYSAWSDGRTGYPLVDAGMRELWKTGWMHNRVRMVVASFLVKHLLVDWRLGEAWFWDTLVDADLANNVGNWQWVAGCGADAAPYFRIFNPTLQAEKFDPQGKYIRRWVPELAQLSNRWLIRPWEAPARELNDAAVVLGKTYPLPVINHNYARMRALNAYQRSRSGATTVTH